MLLIISQLQKSYKKGQKKTKKKYQHIKKNAYLCTGFNKQ